VKPTCLVPRSTAGRAERNATVRGSVGVCPTAETTVHEKTDPSRKGFLVTFCPTKSKISLWLCRNEPKSPIQTFGDDIFRIGRWHRPGSHPTGRRARPRGGPQSKPLNTPRPQRGRRETDMPRAAAPQRDGPRETQPSGEVWGCAQRQRRPCTKKPIPRARGFCLLFAPQKVGSHSDSFSAQRTKTPDRSLRG